MTDYNGYYGNNQGFITRLTNYDTSGTDISLKIPNFYTGTFTATGNSGDTHTLNIYMNAPPTSFIFSSSYDDGTGDIYMCTQTIIVGWYISSSQYNASTTTSNYGAISSGAYIGLTSNSTNNFTYSTSNYFNMTITEYNTTGYHDKVAGKEFGYSILVLN